MNRFKRFFLTMMIVISGCMLFASPFEILDMSAGQITLKFELPEIQFETIERDGITYQAIHVDGASMNAEEGYPQLPYFSEMIGLPVNGNYSLHVVRQQTETLSGYTPVPAPKMVLEGEEQSWEFFRNNLAYASKSIYPEMMLNKGGEGFMGDRHFAGVIFNPVRYKASTNELYVTREATIRITITGDTSPSENWEQFARWSDSGLSKMFLNDSYSRKWLKPRQKAEHYSQNRSDIVDELQIVVDEDAIYHITYDQLADSLEVYQDSLQFATSLNWTTLDPRYLALYNENGPVPIYVHGENDGSFDEDDYIEFFGERHAGDEGYYDDYTSENVYTLKLSDQYGARMAVENGGLVVYDEDQYIVPQSYQTTVHFEKQLTDSHLGFYAPKYREDTWFWKQITAPNLEIIPFELQYPHMSNTRPFHAKVMLMGSTHPDEYYPDHHAVVRINSTMIGTKWWDGQSEQLFEDDAFLANSYLSHGENSLYISLAGDTGALQEQVLLDWIELTYWRLYQTDEDNIRFTKPANGAYGVYQFEVGGFESDDIYVYKIGSSLMENPTVEAFSETGGAPYTLKFQDDIEVDGLEYIALTGDQKKRAKFIHPNLPSNLKSPDHFANYLIITPQRFVENEGTLLYKQLWEQYGQSIYGKPIDVEIVAVEDIYDEFNNGIRSGDAIKDFIRYAYNNWNLPENGGTDGITHVLLLGEGTYDERDDSVNRYYNMIPIRFYWTYKHGYTASDNDYACIEGDDGVPEVHIARINVWQSDQILPVAQKTQHYIENPNYDDMWHSRMTYAAGGKASDDDDIFAQDSESLISNYVPKRFESDRVYTAVQSVPQEFFGGTFILKDYIEQGTLFLQFMGHGGGRIWADYDLLNSNDVTTLTNDNYPFVSSMACYCSSFDTRGMVSMSEVFVMTPEAGAIGHVGFSGLGYLVYDYNFSVYLNEGLFKYGILNMGELITYVKSRVWAEITSTNPKYALTYGTILSGDPMIRLSVPSREAEVTLSDYTPSEDETITISANLGTDVVAATYQVYDDDGVRINVPYPIIVTNGQFQTNYLVPTSSGSIYGRMIKVIGYGANGEVAGYTNFTVGKSAIVDPVTIPDIPTANDSVSLSARFFDDEGVAGVDVNWWLSEDPTNTGTIDMVYSEDEDTWLSDGKIPPFDAGYTVKYKYQIEDSLGDTLQSKQYFYEIEGPDLRIMSIETGEENHEPVLRALVRNYGLTSSPEASARLYHELSSGDRFRLISTNICPTLDTTDQTWVTLKLPTEPGTYKFWVKINEEHSFTESSYSLNSKSLTITINPFILTYTDNVATSIDGNLDVEIPMGTFPDSTIGMLSVTEVDEVVEMPDVYDITLANSSSSMPYEIRILDESLLADSTGTLPGNARVKLTFHYAGSDSINTIRESDNRFHIYRWEEDYRKWVSVGGMTSATEDEVMVETNRLGIYTVFYNDDTTIPQIDANVEDQEFTQGGYISGSGVISFTCSDANGIDVIDHPIRLYLDGQELPTTEYTVTTVAGDLTSVPLKYPLNLEHGEYTMLISCSDVNGNYNERTIPFKVNTSFDIINVANYPNPVISNAKHRDNIGRTRFTYVLTDDADKVKIKIYTVSGRLVKEFKDLPTSVGYHEYPRTTKGWDCRDKNGEYLANGVYFYRVVAKKGSKEIEKTYKMAILR